MIPRVLALPTKVSFKTEDYRYFNRVIGTRRSKMTSSTQLVFIITSSGSLNSRREDCRSSERRSRPYYDPVILNCPWQQSRAAAVLLRTPGQPRQPPSQSVARPWTCYKSLWDRVHERGARFCEDHDHFSSNNGWNLRCQLVTSVFHALRP
ncbi:hypothetical protein B0T10DRAFT_498703 [Thelonectria olida]|uniref:Uncharacterized protein n=1 Tax=Thelonectria olida TaxID=1576542 RepID=A0A9P8VRQ5_9HYPO|nr:hypothetical protein B0T10DRAFT_498703 [Thelonectria olida]